MCGRFPRLPPSRLETGCAATLRKTAKQFARKFNAGVSDGKWIEVVKRRTYPTSGEPGDWEDFTDADQVIAGDLSEVADGKQVTIESAK